MPRTYWDLLEVTKANTTDIYVPSLLYWQLNGPLMSCPTSWAELGIPQVYRNNYTERLEITPCKPNSHLNKSSLGLASSWAPYSVLSHWIGFFYKHYNCLCRGHWNYYTKLVHLTNSDSSNSQVLKIIIIRNKRYFISTLCNYYIF